MDPKTAVFFLLLQPREGTGWHTASYPVYQAMAQLWTRSLRQTGYAGDIWLLKHPGSPVSNAWLEAHEIQVGDVNWRPNEVEPMNVFAKLHASEFFPAENYEKVLGADVDLVAFRQLNHLFALPGDLNAMEQPANNMKNPKLWGGLLNQSEREQVADRPAVNCGVYVCRGTFLAALESRWRRAHVENDGWNPSTKKKTEQHAFNRMIGTESIDFVPFPQRLVKCPVAHSFYSRPKPPPDLALLHYAGKGPRDRFKTIESWLHGQTP